MSPLWEKKGEGEGKREMIGRARTGAGREGDTFQFYPVLTRLSLPERLLHHPKVTEVKIEKEALSSPIYDGRK